MCQEESNPMNAPRAISVVIPTYNRADHLLRCLAALQHQTIGPSKFEVIVVDDGSTDETHNRLRPFITTGFVRYFRQDNSGPARARNVGIRAATGQIILFLGDDIMAAPQLLEEHLSYRRRFTGEPLAVLGFTEWSDTADVTPLMNYQGLGQFGYHRIQEGSVDPDNLSYKYFYTCNGSVDRQFLLDNDLFFDEDYVYAMGEDGELAYRMQQKGLRIVYDPRALAYHEHHTTFEDACRRKFLMGQIDVLHAKKHPELSDLSFLNSTWQSWCKHRVRRLVAWLVHPILRFVDRRRWDICKLGLHRWYDFVFQVHKFEGLRHGLQVYDVSV